VRKLVIVFVSLLALVASIAPTAASSSAFKPSDAPRIKVKQGTSTNWSGYAVETNLASPQKDAVSDVSGSWVVPSLQCGSANSYSSIWVGIDGYSDNTVEQTGTEQDCVNGQASYSAWFEMYPRFPVTLPASSYPVAPGDTISAEVRYSGKNQFLLTLTNSRNGSTLWSYSTTQKAKAQRESAEWIVEAPWSRGVLPLADFGTVQFSGASATLNGTSGTISNKAWQNDPITMVTSSGTVKAQPSSLSNGGSGFSVTWYHN